MQQGQWLKIFFFSSCLFFRWVLQPDFVSKPIKQVGSTHVWEKLPGYLQAELAPQPHPFCQQAELSFFTYNPSPSEKQFSGQNGCPSCYRFFSCKHSQIINGLVFMRKHNIKSEMRSFKSNENIHKKECGSYYVVSANKASSVTLTSSTCCVKACLIKFHAKRGTLVYIVPSKSLKEQIIEPATLGLKASSPIISAMVAIVEIFQWFLQLNKHLLLQKFPLVIRLQNPHPELPLVPH